MTIAEIYSAMSNQLIQGMMFHEQMSNYYDFLGLNGYKRCHEYQFLTETNAYRKVNRYYINHHNRLIPDTKVQVSNVIPESWYRYERDEVDVNTKRNAVKSGLQKWIEWEQSTKTLFCTLRQEICMLQEYADLIIIDELIADVDCELKKAQRYMLTKKALDFSIDNIIADQDVMHHKYKKKERKLNININ